ncbi:MAG: MmcB family DNA repair protein [Blastomonas sp.]
MAAILIDQAPDDIPGMDAGAAAVARGIARLFRRNQIWVTSEVSLPNGRRADLMGLDEKGQIVIVEIKVSKADLLGDMKWPEYLDYCDRFYWGIGADIEAALLDRQDFMPERSGLIVADAYDAEILRPASTVALAAARRKSETARLARLALRRMALMIDPPAPGQIF